jgi:hypothetical protein
MSCCDQGLGLLILRSIAARVEARIKLALSGSGAGLLA